MESFLFDKNVNLIEVRKLEQLLFTPDFKSYYEEYLQQISEYLKDFKNLISETKNYKEKSTMELYQLIE